jgi:hypothetical protein
VQALASLGVHCTHAPDPTSHTIAMGEVHSWLMVHRGGTSGGASISVQLSSGAPLQK